jgi:ribosome-associated protein
MVEINSRISISLDEITLSYSRSAGPGGQNVNKVNSKVTLHWDVVHSQSLPEDIKQRFLQRHHGRINKLGQLVLSSQRSRHRRRNVEDCFSKLRTLVLEVLVPPKTRRPTRPTRGAKERRLRQKREASSKKQQRRPPSLDT